MDKIKEITLLEDSEFFVAYNVIYEEDSFWGGIQKENKFLLKKQGRTFADFAETANGEHVNISTQRLISDLIKHHFSLWSNEVVHISTTYKP